ncbi:uncharacterized protein LOC103569568 [Microplitis demolitor]|uniref:uncharacterized protein LOC103569568 n=1 Tax=Microplitis demolitor TaxID=69319 RepID=UPI0004CDC673|nr:uncharacterized protein LOC103569568 [Microplitis demolitor]
MNPQAFPEAKGVNIKATAISIISLVISEKYKKKSLSIFIDISTLQLDILKAEEIDSKSNKSELLKEDHLQWILPVFQLKYTNDSSSLYQYVYKCQGILVKPDTALTARLCIKNTESYAVGIFHGTSSTDGFNTSLHHIRKSLLDYDSTFYEAGAFVRSIHGVKSSGKITIPGVSILFLESPINNINPIAINNSPSINDIYKNINKCKCLRISITNDSNPHSCFSYFDERVIPYFEFINRWLDAHSVFSVDENLMNIFIQRDLNVFATVKNSSLATESLLGSPLICKNDENEYVLAGLLINTYYDKMFLYANLAQDFSWLNEKLNNGIGSMIHSELNTHSIKFRF